MLESSDFYVAFEDRFRGARDDIKRRVSVYLPLIQKVTAIVAGPTLRVLDVGCGRGEWLDVLREAGVAAYGRDTNEVMVSRCKDLGLDVEVEDALSHLRGLSPDSLGAVTGFHIIEHLSLADQEALLTESLRVLCPGGIALFETPNPENLSVGGHFFYTDPTHLRPLPPALLGHMAEAVGFASAHIVRLHPDHRLADYLDDALSPMEQDVALQLFGPQDFSLIAMKQATKEQSTAIEQGIRLLAASTAPPTERAPSRALRLQQQLDAALQAKEAERQRLDAALQAKEAERQRLDAALHAKEAEVRDRVTAADARAQVAAVQAHMANVQLAAVYSSHSWRVTRPLRWLSESLRRIAIRPVGRFLLSHPRLAKPVKALFRKHPALFRSIRNIVLSNPVTEFSWQAEQVKTKQPELQPQNDRDASVRELHIDELMHRVRKEMKRIKPS